MDVIELPKDLSQLHDILSFTYKISSKSNLSIPEQTKRLFDIVERGISLISTSTELDTVDYNNKSQLAEILLNSKLFSSQLKRIIPFLIIKGAVTSPSDEFYGCLWLVYTIIYQAITLKEEWISQLTQTHYIYKLTKEIREPIDGRLELPAVKLLQLICSNTILNINHQSYLNQKLVDYLFDMIEFLRDKDDILEEQLIQLILIIHQQLTSVQSLGSNSLIITPASSPTCSTQNLIDPENPQDQIIHGKLSKPTIILSTIESKSYTAKTFGEALIFLLNRATDISIQCTVLKFLIDVFDYTPTSHYFYTNDLHVLIDIIIRQLNNLCSSSDPIKLDYLNCLSTLLPNSQYSSHFYKFVEIDALLNNLSQSMFSDYHPDLCLNIQKQAQVLLIHWNELKSNNQH